MAATAPAPSEGSWAGDRLVATVTPGGMTVRSDCADGAIDAPLHLDATGRFATTGRFVVGHGGPQRADQADQRAPARYSGQVRGDRMSLTIDDGSGAPRHFELVRGAHLKLIRCL